jgi:quaternary ammonium compound-resistance protein SugE
LLEAAWVYLLKESDGFRRLWPSVGFVLTAGGSLLLLMYALRSLPVGTSYAIWTGIGAACAAGLGIVALGEPATAARIASIAVIIAGVIGLRLTT